MFDEEKKFDVEVAKNSSDVFDNKDVSGKFIFASSNSHKIEEIRKILAKEIDNFDVDSLISYKELGIDDPVEDGKTFEENAYIKAKYVSEKTSSYAIADDSGLCVEIMGNAPGIFSARWCGKHGDDKANIDLLLKQMSDIKPINRRAKFVSVATLVTPEGKVYTETGQVHGTILFASKGKDGFGYDPIFQPDGYDTSFAELGEEIKNNLSHRKIAFEKLAEHIRKLLNE